MQYAEVKAWKRMDNYRSIHIKPGQEPKLLVPVSRGVSSTVLLHVLDHLQNRQRAGYQERATHQLHILHVELPTAGSSGTHGIDTLREVYPPYQYTTIPFNAIFKYDKEIGGTISELSASGFEDNPSKTDQERLDSFLSSLSSATSRTDIEYNLLMRLIVAFAKDQGCSGILWGHSDSRLAGRVLSDVAKGRGFSLPWQVCEGASPSGLHDNFPLRDLFKSELEIYSTLLPERVSEVIIPDSPVADISYGTKSTSIEDLMTHYIESQGPKYPSIMANIVRTVNKLEPPSLHEDDIKCSLCAMPMADTIEGVNDIQVSNGAPVPARESGEKRGNYCYGCARSCQDIESS